ncbi:hypothetical protein LEP1GSC173_3318 [Leptospira interrogans str. HAI1594]|uniref:Uncharacterized protein n=5 Tax=Leptospira interrogans TaxID=173 RepID=M6ZI40_LEPIR|nr:hypothetical protein LEP1GSC080_4683 [Leptospira interrogans str. FPW2026]EKN86001.1 hypothetical protein LEP1GSC027_3050 [Leptospira interrogans str. 2002000624]EKO06063.1 hypothetical protein LEP1GSC077_1949 [Leptospira interrogans str. C10069]EKO25516.1 hypothetical protein LEP1GSC104_4797 [Leptospira interrogans str. UI 12621]EKO88222.1 hypothetical protein LEP1GSC009_4769 [Leptospira interrogans serovar Grippotyphosa str. Andaman]EKP20143.1 hypothetical protein LEP1GSC117_0429 [Leptosp
MRLEEFVKSQARRFFPNDKNFFVKKKLGVPTILLIQNIPHIKL